ncbi:MAG TPA: efflux RND transporter periplasmic adaptor subunit [Pirellulales bacterium]
MNFRIRLIWKPAVAVVLATIFAPLVRAHDEHEALPSKGATAYKNLLLITPQAEKAIGLQKAKITLADWREEIVVNATVDVPCTRHAYAASLVSGKIDELLVRPGDDVQAGQVLARVRSLELETIQSQLLQVSAEHDLAARTLDQHESLAQGGALPQRDLFLSRANRREKVAELALLMAKLRSIGLSPDTLTEIILSKQPLRSLPVISPITGSIALADVRIGQTVDPSDPIFQLIDRSGVVFVGEVLESDVWRVRVGMPVRVVLASFPDQPLEAKLEHVGLKLDERRRTMQVRAEMPNSEGRIRPGMFGRMHIEVTRTTETVVCPAEALIRRGDRHYVLREQGRDHGKYALTRVVVGSRDEGRVEIVDGLFPGQRVITVGTLELAALLNDAFDVADAQTESSPRPQPAAAPAATASSGDTPARPIVVPGKIEAETGRKQFAAATVSGRLASILVERGTRVKRGDVLAEIDSLQLRNLQLDLLGAKVRLDLARQSLKRLRDLNQDRLVNRQSIWELESSERSLETKLAALAGQLGLLGLEPREIEHLKKIDLSKADVHEQMTTLLPVRAPADGWVVDFELGLGEVVQPLERLFELQNLAKIWVQAYVREGDIARVGVGQPVTVTVAGDPTFRAHGRVTRASPLVSATDRVLSVWAELDNSDLRLREGMLATVAIEAGAGTWPVARGARRDER